jgi:hypothetical protein
VETWYEALELPGKLKEANPLVHPLMVLGFDVYEAPVSETVRKLRGLNFDLSKLHQTTWRGRPTCVVGAEPGDTVSPQFWIDIERPTSSGAWSHQRRTRL